MTEPSKIVPELQARVDALAARAGRASHEVIADALENGHSLEWQERFIDKVMAGVAEADAGRFASTAEIDRVRHKYRPS